MHPFLKMCHPLSTAEDEGLKAAEGVSDKNTLFLEALGGSGCLPHAACQGQGVGPGLQAQGQGLLGVGTGPGPSGEGGDQVVGRAYHTLCS